MHANRLAAFLFDLAKKIDGIGLKRRDVRISIQRMYPTSRMPAGPRRQDGTFKQRNIGPAHL